MRKCQLSGLVFGTMNEDEGMSTGLKTNGSEVSKGNRFKTPTRTPQVRIATASPIERGGETHRERTRVRVRDAFMASEGVDRSTFEKKYGDGAGYKKWRAFAEQNGLHLPA